MIKRKNYLVIALAVIMMLSADDLSAKKKEKVGTDVPQGIAEREYLVKTLIRIADPVLQSLSNNQLKEKMPVESVPKQEADRKNYTYLEALGRTLAGMAPWLELGPDDSPEGKLREKYILLSLESIRNATNPESADFMNFTAIQERLISPEGTYPLIGRSITYRFGAFQVLAKMALLNALPKNVSPQQVRAALYTLVKRQIEVPGTFDNDGWLTIGVAGHQPKSGESYISTGSLYLCTEGLLMLGLPSTDPFWQGNDEKWTSQKAWDGEYFPIDHAL